MLTWTLHELLWSVAICWFNFTLLSVKKIHLTHYIWRAFFLYERIECQLWEKAASQGLPITNIAFEWLFLFMKWFMHLQTCFERKSFITKITLEWFVSFMDWFNMPIKMSFERKSWVTNITFEGLYSFMNSFNMPRYSNVLFEKNLHHNHYIGMASFLWYYWLKLLK